MMMDSGFFQMKKERRPSGLGWYSKSNLCFGFNACDVLEVEESIFIQGQQYYTNPVHLCYGK
jgi:hypothetical protein